MVANIILVLSYLLLPAAILYLCHRFPFVNKIGSVVIAYILGLIIGNTGILPEGSYQFQDALVTVTIPLAIPLLLFSANIRSWFAVAGRTMISMLVALVSVVIMVTLGYLLFRGGGMQDLWKIGGMMVGVYSGGTPNLASLQMMLDVNPDTYIITHTYDMILSSIYLFFLITIGKKVFSLILPPYRHSIKINKEKRKEVVFNGGDPYWGMFKKNSLKKLSLALGLSILIFAIGGGISLLVPESQQMVVAILLITSLGIAASFIPRVNRIERSFEAGMYLILIFSIVVASMADITQFSGAAPNLFKYVTFVVFGSLVLHVLFSSLFKVDTDTVMITSTALICSPPFVPVIAGAIRNREVIVSGLTVGIIGYAVGNYLGFMVAEMLKILP